MCQYHVNLMSQTCQADSKLNATSMSASTLMAWHPISSHVHI